VKKNKVAPPYKLAEFDILFGTGISATGCLLDAAEAVGVVAKRGSWYYHGEQRLAQVGGTRRYRRPPPHAGAPAPATLLPRPGGPCKMAACHGVAPLCSSYSAAVTCCSGGC
jgi:hypothetical protein